MRLTSNKGAMARAPEIFFNRETGSMIMLDSLKEAEKNIRHELGRTIFLPRNVDVGKAEAGYKNGVMSIRPPKVAGENSRTITVS